MKKNEITKLEKIIGYQFEDIELLKNAFIHRSYLNEHPQKEYTSNERLEFLGDAVLELLTSKKLYQKFPNHPEGDLTNYRAALVCTESLAGEAARLGLGRFLYLSKGEEETGGRDRPYILANTFEALLGSLYLDQGIATCQEFVNKNIFYKIETIIKEGSYKDAKSILQELTQEERGITPAYKVLAEWGPDHAKHFRMGVFLNDERIGTGKGASKQNGEQTAAENALNLWETLEN